jgi:hypothetical protein
MNIFETLPLLGQADAVYGGGELTDGQAAGLMAFLAAYTFVMIGVAIFAIACYWKIFTKADKPGWAAIVPIYNIIVFLEIIGRPVWWIVLLCIPFVNIVVGIICVIDLAKSFGKSGGFAAGLILLTIVFLPMLAFGSAQYQGPAAAEGEAAPAA